MNTDSHALTPSEIGQKDGINNIRSGWNPRPEDYGFEKTSDEWNEYMDQYREARKGWDR